jgi:sugar-specific transcriptional regulator TrmB
VGPGVRLTDRLDLTPFGFTPTESLVYEVLLTQGPGTGYAVARSAGLARANAYAALEGLVTKGAARSDAGRPRRYRPEPPDALLARVTESQGRALDRLAERLAEAAVPATPSVLELDSARGALQLLGREIARASARVVLFAPPEAWPALVPALRRAAGAGVELRLLSPVAQDLGFAAVGTAANPAAWPGEALIGVVDDRSAVLAGREGDRVVGHWTASPPLVAAARLVLEGLGGG